MELVQAAIKAASYFRDSSFETRDKLTATCDELRESAISSNMSIENKANEENSRMVTNLEMFSTGMNHLTEINNNLEELETCMTTKGRNHVQLLSSLIQTSILNAMVMDDGIL
jgi:hypothetical protein